MAGTTECWQAEPSTESTENSVAQQVSQQVTNRIQSLSRSHPRSDSTDARPAPWCAGISRCGTLSAELQASSFGFGTTMGGTDRNLRKTTASQVDCPAIRPWQPSARSNGWNSHRDYARMGNVRQPACLPDLLTISHGGDGYKNT